MPTIKHKIGDTEVEYESPEENPWIPVEDDNKNPWLSADNTPKDDRGYLRKGWDFLNTPLTTYLSPEARQTTREFLAYGPLKRPLMSSLGLNEKAQEGVEQGTENLAEGLITPLSIGTMGAGGLITKLPALAKGLISGGFAGSSLWNAYEQGKTALTTEDPEEQARSIVETGGNLAFSALGAHGVREAFRSKPTSVISDIRNGDGRLLENAKASEHELPPFQQPITTPYEAPWEPLELNDAKGPVGLLGDGNKGVFNRPDVPYKYNVKRPTQGNIPTIDVDSKVTPVEDVKLSPESSNPPVSGEPLIKPFTKSEDTSNLRQLPTKYQEQFPKQSMYGVEGAPENVSKNLEGLESSKRGWEEIPEQTQLNKDNGSEKITTSGMVQEPSPIIPVGKYSSLPLRSGSELHSGLSALPEAMEHVKNTYEDIKKNFGDFVPTFMKELGSSPKPFGITPDKDGRIGVQSLEARMNGRISMPEKEMLESVGFNKWMKENSSGGKVDINNALQYLQENAPKVEVRKLEANGTETSDIERQFAELQHTYYDSIRAEEMSKFNRSVREAQGNYDKLKENLLREGFNEKMTDGLVKYQQNKNFLESYEGRIQKTQKNESATARYTMVNPKPLDQMPGAVDLLVRIPEKVEQVNESNKGINWKGDRVTNSKFTSQHYPTEGKNLIAHVRGYMETLPSGEKVFHVFEVQSDWAQHVREVNESQYKNHPENKNLVDKLQDPTLAYYEHLALKAAIKHAIDNGASKIAISDANTAMLSEMHDQAAIIGKVVKRLPIEPNIDNAEWTAKVAELKKQYPEPRYRIRPNWVNSETANVSIIDNEAYDINQEKGMRLHYDESLPNITRKLTGSEPSKVDFGEHQNVREAYRDNGLGGRIMIDDKTPNLRDNLILKDPSTGKPQTNIKANLFSLDKLTSRVSELKEPFSTYSTLYSGIPLDAFGKAIKNTLNDLISKGNKEKAKQMMEDMGTFAVNKVRDVVHATKALGPEGEVAGEAIRKYFLHQREYRGPFVNGYLDAMKLGGKLNKTDQVKLNRWAWEEDNGVKHTYNLSTQQKAQLDALRKINLDVHKEQRQLGIKINGRDPLDSPTYWQGITDTGVLNIITKKPSSPEALKLKDEWVKHTTEKAARMGKSYTPEQARTDLKNYINALGKPTWTSDEFNAVRKAAGYGIPWSWQEKNLPRMFEKYGNKVATDFAFFKSIQNDPLVRGILNEPDQFGHREQNAKVLPNGKPIEAIDATDPVKDFNMFRNKVYSTTDVNSEALGQLLRSGIVGLSTGVGNYAQNLPKAMPYMTSFKDLGLYIKAHSEIVNGLKEAYKQGVARINPAEIANPNLGYNMFADAIRGISNLSYRAQLGAKIENSTRAIDFNLGKLLTTAHMGNAFSKGGKADIMMLDDLVKTAGVEDWRKFKNQMPNLPQEWLNKMAASFTEKVQQTYDLRDNPAWTLKSKMAPFMSLSRWAFGASNHIYRDVVEPMYKGNYIPALGYLTMSGIVGGTALPMLNQLLSGRKARDPSIKEALQEENPKEIALAFANALHLASFGGIVGVMIKSGIEISQGRSPRGFTFPVVDFIANTLVERTRQAAEAIENGEPRGKVIADYLVKAIEDNVQTLRIAANQTINKADIEHSNKVRDLQTFRRLEGEPEIKTPSLNPFLGGTTKEFKRTTDVNQIAPLGIKAIQHQMDIHQGDPLKMVSGIQGLKSNPITWMPSAQRSPLEFTKYVDFVRKSQGEKAASKLINQYATTLAINKAKSQMIPSMGQRSQ